MTFDGAYALQILPLLFKGAVITVVAAILSFALAASLGPFVAIARSSSSRSIRVTTGAAVDFIRSTPLLIQLFVVFYILPLYGLAFEPLLTGIVVLGIHYASYTSEVYRVDHGRATGAMGGGCRPEPDRAPDMATDHPAQAVPRIIPPLGNYLVAIFKDTPILATITVAELLRVALTEAGRTYRFLGALRARGPVLPGDELSGHGAGQASRAAICRPLTPGAWGADRVVFMDGVRVVEAGPPEGVLGRPPRTGPAQPCAPRGTLTIHGAKRSTS